MSFLMFPFFIEQQSIYFKKMQHIFYAGGWWNFFPLSVMWEILVLTDS